MKNIRKKVISSVKDFIKGGDNSDVKLLDMALHESFRNVQNGFFTEKGIFTINKHQYIKLIEDRTFGGVPRTIDIQSVEIHGGIAMVKSELKSEQLTFTSFISLVQDEESDWKVVGNFPHVISS